MRSPRFIALALALLVLPLALGACVNGVNGSVSVAAGTSTANASTVNGSVHVEANAKADKASTVNGSVDLASGAQVGEVSTVNGGVDLGDHASAGSVDAVNGHIALASGATVSGNVTAVNGKLGLAPGSAVNGKLTNVNGKIDIADAHVGEGITTANGDITITGKSVIDGGIKVVKSKGNGFFGIHFGSDTIPTVTIGPDATVNGPLDFERPVKLYISDQAHVAGPITGAEVVKFPGATPPAS